MNSDDSQAGDTGATRISALIKTALASAHNGYLDNSKVSSIMCDVDILLCDLLTSQRQEMPKLLSLVELAQSGLEWREYKQIPSESNAIEEFRFRIAPSKFVNVNWSMPNLAQVAEMAVLLSVTQDWISFISQFMVYGLRKSRIISGPENWIIVATVMQYFKTMNIQPTAEDQDSWPTAEDLCTFFDKRPDSEKKLENFDCAQQIESIIHYLIVENEVQKHIDSDGISHFALT